MDRLANRRAFSLYFFLKASEICFCLCLSLHEQSILFLSEQFVGTASHRFLPMSCIVPQPTIFRGWSLGSAAPRVVNFSRSRLKSTRRRCQTTHVCEAFLQLRCLTRCELIASCERFFNCITLSRSSSLVHPASRFRCAPFVQINLAC